MARKILLMIVVFLATASTTLFALGLGNIKLKSGLNQPLDAEITLLSVRGESNDQLRGMLASSVDFNRIGIERVFFLTKIRFETITKANGVHVLHLTSEDAVKEPFLNFLVDLEWPNGRLLREYTLLLDPPIFDDAPDTIITPAVVEPSTKTQQTIKRRQEPKTQVLTETTEWQGDIYGPTTGSDTLWGIAAQVRPNRSISMQQAMLTIFEANPNAFMRGNINNLKRGAEIRVPDAEVFKHISQRDALKIIAAHNKTWKSGKRPPSRLIMDTTDSEPTILSREESKELDSGRLSLSTDTEEMGKTGGASFAANAEEDNEVLKQQNDTLQQQSQTDADRIRQLERLLELKNEQLANIQSRASADESISEVVKESQTKVTATIDSADPMLDVAATKPMSEPDNKGWVDELMAGTYNTYLGISAGVILLMLLVYMSRRRRQGEDYQQTVSGIKTTERRLTGDPETVENLPESADTVLEGTAVSDVEETPDSDDKTASTDPLGEADIYIAYGKFDQAETLLLSAIQADPERLELNSKLLECFAEMDEQNKFEQQVSSISNALESDPELKNYIEELYQTTWPESSFFNLPEDNEVAETETDEAETEEIIDSSLNADADVEVLMNDQEDMSSLDDPQQDDSSEVLMDTPDSAEVDDVDEISLDIDGFDEEDDDDGDDVETQLDLAKAYVEMGDIEGTREIIKEILETGTEQQCEEAQKILDGLDE